MRIYPVMSNSIRVELDDGTLFELREGNHGLNIEALNGTLVASELNVETIGFDEVWRGSELQLESNP